jgi:hypothetical protein
MNADAGLESGRGFAPFVRPRTSVGHRQIRNERGGQMPLAWWVVGAATFALATWAIANALLRWATLD